MRAMWRGRPRPRNAVIFIVNPGSFNTDSFVRERKPHVERNGGIYLHCYRRNLVTRGVPLNHLVGREFRIGDGKIRGIRLCEPCSHLQALTPIIKGLIRRGGLRLQILSEGTIHVGDVVRE